MPITTSRRNPMWQPGPKSGASLVFRLYINSPSPTFLSPLHQQIPAHSNSKTTELSSKNTTSTLKSTNLKMGICSSCDSTHVATAKLILQDGRLQEFPYPVKVSYVLQSNPMCFICNSDEMDFDDAVSAIEEDEELQPGQLYFALPLSWLKHPLQAEEMAALAVKASSALMKSSGGEKCGCRRKTFTPFAFSEEPPSRKVASAVGGGGGEKSGRGRRKFEAILSAIPE